MRAVVQRVKKSSVTVADEVIGAIDKGLMVLIAVASTDNDATINWFTNKLINLRIFEDEAGKMNKSLLDVNGELLIVSNFTLYGDARKGFRPSFGESAEPVFAENIYDKFVDNCRKSYPNIKIETGSFGAMMDVMIVNDGPVTIIIDK